MENNNASSNVKAWSLFGFSTAGMVVFALLYFLNPKTTLQTQTITSTVTNVVTNTVTNEVVKEVPKEVEKIVNVPIEIPASYTAAMELYQKITNATSVTQEQVLFKMKDVRPVCVLGDGLKQILSEDEVKAKFELSTRDFN